MNDKYMMGEEEMEVGKELGGFSEEGELKNKNN